MVIFLIIILILLLIIAPVFDIESHNGEDMLTVTYNKWDSNLKVTRVKKYICKMPEENEEDF